MSNYVNDLLSEIKMKNPNEPEYHQAVQEFVESVAVVLDRHPEYRSSKILERILEPDRIISFRVAWVDDQGEIRINKG
jgi:glutamate dehydrogenase (NADP+)